jgi:AAHS family 4-hydroxybenzoate transporter-like MFS transporter
VVLGRFGFTAIALLFLLAVPAIAALGLPGVSWLTMLATVTLAGFCTLGAQFGNNAASGLLYPTAFRSRGSGWALGVGRFGSVIGPLLGGVLIALRLPLRQLFLLASLPMVVGLIASAIIAGLCHRRLGGLQIDDMTQQPPLS